MDKDTISTYFSQFGEVVNCSIPVNKSLNRPKNFCNIKFNERTAFLKTLDKKQHQMGEKIVLVTEFVEKMKGIKKLVTVLVVERNKPSYETRIPRQAVIR